MLCHPIHPVDRTFFSIRDNTNIQSTPSDEPPATIDMQMAACPDSSPSRPSSRAREALQQQPCETVHPVSPGRLVPPVVPMYAFHARPQQVRDSNLRN